METDLQLWSIGTAAVVDTALLVALVERANLRSVNRWMLHLTAGVWLWHTGAFFQAWLSRGTVPFAVELRWMAMVVMVIGLLTIPSAMLHGLFRLYQTGITIANRPRRRLALCYLPLLAVVPIGISLARDPQATFVDLVAPYKMPYLVWMALANALFAGGLFHYRRFVEVPQNRRLIAWMVTATGGLTLVDVVLVLAADHVSPSLQSHLYTCVILTPVVPICMFAYFLMRFQFLPLVLERTFVYGAFVGGIVLLHELALRDVASAVRTEYRVDLAFIEALLISALVIAYQPLRRRVLESFQYLIGSPRQVREENRRLAVELAAQAGRPVPELLDWFAHSVPSAFQIEAVALWLFDADGAPPYRSGSTDRFSDRFGQEVYDNLRDAHRAFCTRADAPAIRTLEMLRGTGAWGAIRLEHRDLRGLLVFWPQIGNQPVADERVNALLLLVEQLAATIANSQLLEAHRAAERRMLQQEKLSTLGLLAGSIAHEVKNPLSSMRTIASVLAEELGEDSPQAEGLQMIVSEVDRLVGVTNQLLEIARPARSQGGQCDLRMTLLATCRLLRHHAQNAQVSLEMRLDEAPILAQADGSAVREILFNLLLNGIEAAGAGGKVEVASDLDTGKHRLEIRNSGPPIPPATLERLFEPFFTTKPTGTGLGLYLVAQRTRELGGEIHCRSSHDEGTCFELRLPAVDAEPAVPAPVS